MGNCELVVICFLCAFWLMVISIWRNTEPLLTRRYEIIFKRNKLIINDNSESGESSQSKRLRKKFESFYTKDVVTVHRSYHRTWKHFNILLQMKKSRSLSLKQRWRLPEGRCWATEWNLRKLDEAAAFWSTALAKFLVHKYERTDSVRSRRAMSSEIIDFAK